MFMAKRDKWRENDPTDLGALGESAKSGIESISDFLHDKMKDIKK